MAGVDQDGQKWAQSYNSAAWEAVGFFEDVHSTLNAYGTALNDIGFNHAQSDATLKGTPQPDRPADAPVPVFGPFSVPASAGGPGHGIVDAGIDMASHIGIPVPDGDTGKLEKAADAWDRLGTIYQNTNARDKVTIASTLFDDVTSPDAVHIKDDLKALSDNIDALLTSCTQIRDSCRAYKDALKELRDEIKGFLESLAEELAIDAAITIGLSHISFGAGAVTAAKGAATVKHWATKIKEGITAWRGRKALQIAGLKQESKDALVKARKAIKDLYERLRNVRKSGTAVKPRTLDELFKNRTPKASELENYAKDQGWVRSQTPNGPIKYTDQNGVVRMTIKHGSNRAPGSGNPHVEIRDASGQRTDPFGNPVTRKSPDNHTAIDWDLP
jgi:hypothetical protein